MKKKRLELLGAAVGLVVFGLALWVLHDTLSRHDLGEILRQLSALSLRQLLFASALTICAYLVLIGYDALAFRYVSASLPFRRIALTSFLGYAIGNNSGSWSLITGGGIRFRFYSAWGIEPAQITRVVAFCLFSFWLGFFFLGGLVFFFEPLAFPASLHLPLSSARPLGSLLLLLIAGYLFWTWLGRSLTIFGHTFSPPGTALALAQILVSSLDWALASSVLFVLLPSANALPWVDSLSIFMFAQLAGLASQVPGGLGVFESAILLLLRDKVAPADAAGALLVFRLCYYLIPLLAAALIFGCHELLSRRR